MTDDEKVGFKIVKRTPLNRQPSIGFSSRFGPPLRAKSRERARLGCRISKEPIRQIAENAGIGPII